jgi:formate hydrogenlyase subunit 3/multisubunit Na+/H+ antiporter MnhD subunit
MYFYVPNFDIYFFNISIDIFGLIILFLAYFIGVISLLALDTRLYFKNIKYIYFIHVFILIVFFFVFSNNILLLFFFYELLLLPSFLIVYQISPSRRAIQASLYFII